ncbi:MAG: LysM peptidoglycan-binding domain-containing protein [Akkermansiaceae bacterium]|nr:LysM peptidoglycan-binding domain-containing protein [Akkermansiaceae bacterium]
MRRLIDISYLFLLESYPHALILRRMRGNTAAKMSHPSSLLALPALLSMLLAGCGGGGGGFVSENHSNRGYNPGVGPFDSRGNYVERWADDKSKGVWWRSSSTTGPAAVASKPAVTPPVIASNTTPTPGPASRPTGVRPTPPVGGHTTPTPQARPQPKPKPVVKATPKRKPPIRHTVRSGDTLWALSQKYKTSVTAIQRANGLKGTNLKIGRSLLIPRY